MLNSYIFIHKRAPPPVKTLLEGMDGTNTSVILRSMRNYKAIHFVTIIIKVHGIYIAMKCRAG